MKTTIDEKSDKELLKQAIKELMIENPELFSTVFVEAIEEIGLAKAIKVGRQEDFVSENDILELLKA